MNNLILSLILLQVVLPLALIALNALTPSLSRAGLAIRSSVIFLVLIYVALAGLWLFPPWWTPYPLALLHLGATLWAFRRHRRSETSHRPWLRWTESGLSALAAFAVALLLVPVLQGRISPAAAIDLATPLAPGRYLVLSGGASAAINAHFETLESERAKPFRGQSFAADIIRINRLGLRADGIAPSDPAAYRIYRTQILAPCAGRVAATVDGVPDNPVPRMNRQSMAGNYVLLACSDVYVALAHMIPGSITVRTGETVTVGQPLGHVGNSGNSAEPHLHVHVQRGWREDAPLSGEPAWFTIDGNFLVRNNVVDTHD